MEENQLKVDVNTLENNSKMVSISYQNENGDTVTTKHYYDGRYNGNPIIIELDENAVMIYGAHAINEDGSAPHLGLPSIRIFTKLPVGHSDNAYNAWGDEITITDELKEIKKIIIKSFSRSFVYSYEFGIITSALYNRIYYNEDNKTFFVEYDVATAKGILNLVGTLDSEGHLIDDTLYAPLLKKSYLVDEHNLDFSIAKYIPNMEKEKIKTEEQKTYNELDYQAYLARKKK